MVDTVQLVLLIVIVVLTSLLVILGIQVFYIFKDLRVTIKKTNRVLDNVDSITSNIEGPLSALSSLVLGAKATSLITVAKFVKTLLSKDRERNTDERRRERD